MKAVVKLTNALFFSGVLARENIIVEEKIQDL